MTEGLRKCRNGEFFKLCNLNLKLPLPTSWRCMGEVEDVYPYSFLNSAEVGGEW